MAGDYKYKRVLLKLSGEALAGDLGYGIDPKVVDDLADQISEVVHDGVEVAIVVGGGNIFRGLAGSAEGMDRAQADYIGMLATVMNAIYVSEFFRYSGLDTAILSPLVFGNMTEQFSKDLANRYFAEGKVIFFAAGTGHPYFTTDTAMALRAIETNCDLILAAKNIDGVYDKDPGKNPDAKKYDTISISAVVEQRLGVIDLAASIMLNDNKIPMKIFSLHEENSIANALGKKFNGTIVTCD